MRAIAARAGVNHGLVHHYFGGKEGLRGAVLQHLADRQAAAMGTVADDDPAAVATAALAAARGDDRFFRVLARGLLDGTLPPSMQTAFPVVRALVGSLEGHGVSDAPTRVAAGLATALGWMLFAPWIRAATGVSTEQGEQLLEALVRAQTARLLTERDAL